jgi:hypothetical protein
MSVESKPKITEKLFIPKVWSDEIVRRERINLAKHLEYVARINREFAKVPNA